MDPLFAMGRVVATPAAIEAMREVDVSPADLLMRHVFGDWEEMHPEDMQTNLYAIATGEDSVISAYRYGSVRLCVITEWNRSTTMILLPDEFDRPILKNRYRF